LISGSTCEPTYLRLNCQLRCSNSKFGIWLWKVENESNNVLKTKGYHLEHNYGHGSQFLSTPLLTLNLLAFLAHTFLEVVDTPISSHSPSTLSPKDVLS
jgi:hypothetical protein